jgi:uncharacterized protein YndB with AHSA1/START domain
MEGNTSIARDEDRIFVITRFLAAPRALVFKLWTEPQHIAQWWGPKDFANPVCEMDLRPGGALRITTRAPDGTDYPLKGIFHEITPPERLVASVDLSEHPESWHDLVNPNRDRTQGRPRVADFWEVTFDEQNGVTKLTVTFHLDCAATRDALIRMGINEGWGQSFDRLEALAEALLQR